MDNKDCWASFDQIYCLTLEGDLDRQRHASTELCRAGLNSFKFIEGIKSDSQEVRDAYASGQVLQFPPCFRCGLSSCGNPDCNNILIEPQVGCFLSFIKIFQMALRSEYNTFLVVEDDIKFHPYALELAAAAFGRITLDEIGFFSDRPCLLGLGRGRGQDEIHQFLGQFEFIARRKMPQNPCFAFNKAFAALALSRFTNIFHTSDVFIHFQLSEEAIHFSVEPPLSYEISTSTGELPSRIHPKALAAENPANSEEVRRVAKAQLESHLKHVKVVPLIVLGVPRGGTGYMSHALAQFGYDVGHESLGTDGISSWLFAVDDVGLPFGAEGYARNSRFIRGQKTICVVRTSTRAIFATQLENTKNIQSYSFRRRWIKKVYDVDLDDFSTDFERALGAYVFWYRIIAQRKPDAWISLERAAADLPRLLTGNLLEKRKEPSEDQLKQIINSKKPYLGQVYDNITGDFEGLLEKSDPFLKEAYRELKSLLYPIYRGNY